MGLSALDELDVVIGCTRSTGKGKDDEDQCKQMNALYLQGYKYSKPIPIEELTRFLGRAV